MSQGFSNREIVECFLTIGFYMKMARLTGLRILIVGAGPCCAAARRSTASPRMHSLCSFPRSRRCAPARGASIVPLGRMATAWEIAYAALFLLSDESAYVTAQTLAVDGGVSGI